MSTATAADVTLRLIDWPDRSNTVRDPDWTGERAPCGCPAQSDLYLCCSTGVPWTPNCPNWGNPVRLPISGPIVPYRHIILDLVPLAGAGANSDERRATYDEAVKALGPTRGASLPGEWRHSEVAIVWKPDSDVERYDYVRQTMLTLPSRSRAVSERDLPGRILGWGVVDKTFPGNLAGCFARRVFWVKPYDRHAANDDGGYQHGAPAEAVDPRSVMPKQSGLLTERAWGAKFWDLRIEQAGSYKELVDLYTEGSAAGQWTDALTEQARKRTAELRRGDA
ncbi:DUF6009 family protein [Micromonosporaceae bacterium B7E4]